MQPAPQVGEQFAGAQPSQVGALFAGAHILQVGALLGMGAQPTQAGAPLGMGAQLVLVGAQFAGAQPLQAEAPFVMGAQPSQAGAQYVAGAQPVAQVGAPFAVCAQLVTPAGAQPGALAADWDKENANAMLKLASRAHFCESAGNKIRGFVADLELYLRMCALPVHYWGYFLMASLGAEEAEKAWRSHLADAIEDYAMFKSVV